MKKGLYIGRFQPFHLGHLSAVKQALIQVDFLMIGIGSSQYSGTEKNPFPLELRQQMIQRSLADAGVEEDRYQIIPIPDIHNNPKWPAHVRSLVGDFDVLFMANVGIVKELFETYDSVKIEPLKKEVDISATQIRELMKSGGQWQKFVPKATTEVINSQSI
ncbi:nicotinamide-nucleotide adenylyltransferase [Candidatus Peregrinibacteria bacterium]|nr:MAG: nicotinamide-nucleotide adenylyltransferase [Candidatus Peregrinibacteria bacterium]